MLRIFSVFAWFLAVVAVALPTFAQTRATLAGAARERAEIVAIVRAVRSPLAAAWAKGDSRLSPVWTHPCLYKDTWRENERRAPRIALDEALRASGAAPQTICSGESFREAQGRKPPPPGFRCWRIGELALSYPRFRTGHRRAALAYGFIRLGGCEKTLEAEGAVYTLWLEKRRGIWRIVRKRLDAIT